MMLNEVNNWWVARGTGPTCILFCTLVQFILVFNFLDQTYKFILSWFITINDTGIWEISDSRIPPFACMYTKSFALIRESLRLFAKVTRLFAKDMRLYAKVSRDYAKNIIFSLRKWGICAFVYIERLGKYN